MFFFVSLRFAHTRTKSYIVSWNVVAADGGWLSHPHHSHPVFRITAPQCTLSFATSTALTHLNPTGWPGALRPLSAPPGAAAGRTRTWIGMRNRRRRRRRRCRRRRCPPPPMSSRTSRRATGPACACHRPGRRCRSCHCGPPGRSLCRPSRQRSRRRRHHRDHHRLHHHRR